MKPNQLNRNTMNAANEDIHHLNDKSVTIKRDKMGKKNTVNNVLIKISHLLSDTVLSPMQSAVQLLVGSYECTRAALAHPTTINTWPDSCPTCKTDGPAVTICPVCQRRRPELGPTSCRDCQNKRPKVVMCYKYHSKQPLLCVCPCDECKHSECAVSKSTGAITKPTTTVMIQQDNTESCGAAMNHRVKVEDVEEVKEPLTDKVVQKQEIAKTHKYFNFSKHRHTRCCNHAGRKHDNCYSKKQWEGNQNSNEERNTSNSL